MDQRGFAPILIIASVIIIGGIIIGSYLYARSRTEPLPNTIKTSQPTASFSPSPSLATPLPSLDPGSCDSACQAYINQKVDQAKQEIIQKLQTQIDQNPKSVALASSQPISQPQVIYLNFGVNGSTQATSWTDVAGSDLTFDTSSYPGAKAFYFEGSLVADAPDRTTYARILDVTHGVGVQGSDISYIGNTSTLIKSGSLNFQSGSLTLRVQVHSLNGNFATIQNPRIRVTY